jgi:hypothetical protein
MRVDTDWLGFLRVTVTRNDLGTFRALVLQEFGQGDYLAGERGNSRNAAKIDKFVVRC